MIFHFKKYLLVPSCLQCCSSSDPPHTTGPAPYKDHRDSGTHSSFPEQAGRGVRGQLAHTGGNSVMKDLLVERAPGEPFHVKEGGR